VDNMDKSFRVLPAKQHTVIRSGHPTAGLITRRSQVQILPPLPHKAPSQAGLYSWEASLQILSCPRLAHEIDRKDDRKDAEIPAKTRYHRPLPADTDRNESAIASGSVGTHVGGPR
jgi:hypothetical protein